MFKLFRPAVLAVVLIAIAASFWGCKGKESQPDAAKKTVRVGFMICNSKEETEARFKPLTEYLSQKLGMNVVPVTIDTIDFDQAVRDKKVDFTHTNSLLYIDLNKKYGVEILAGDINGKYKNKSSGAVMVLKDSPIMSLSELKGKKMVFGPIFAPTGYLVQSYMLIKKGIDPEKDIIIKTPQGSFKHEKILFSLMYGDYDAAAVPMLDFEQMSKQGKIDPGDFRIIAESEPIPYCSFGVCENVDEGLAKKFKETILSIKPEDTVEYEGERLKVLKSAMVEGFADVKDSDYDLVREMAKACNMPPYQKF